jgi:hypothetical protein
MAPYILFIALIIIFIALKVLQPKIKGFIGEYKVSTKLSFLSGEYHVFDNVYLENNGFSTQIDHVIISPYGIFVIETKNYTGMIVGTTESEYWTKVQYKKKYKFYNPIKQNRSHVIALKRLFNLSDKYFFPIVVFHNNAEIKVYTTEDVINFYYLRKTINRYKEEILSEKEVEELCSILKSSLNTEKRRNRKHVQNTKRNIVQRKNLVNNRICPKCKGNLVIRQGKHGGFLGCSNYPSCKFTHNL